MARSDGNPLALAARELAGPPIQVVGQVQRPGRRIDTAVLLGLVDPGHAQREGDVLPHRHVRIKRVGLEHHRQAALGRRDVGGVRAVDQDCAGRDVLEPRDQSQERGLAAAGGPDEDAELSVLDVQVQRGNDLQVAKALGDCLKRDLSHVGVPYLTAPKVRPRTSCFWLNQPRIRIGAIAMVEAADSLA